MNDAKSIGSRHFGILAHFSLVIYLKAIYDLFTYASKKLPPDPAGDISGQSQRRSGKRNEKSFLRTLSFFLSESRWQSGWQS